MISLAEDGMSMICVTHELAFARKIADRIIFMDQGQIIGDQPPEEFFLNPGSERAKEFISQILTH
jgi:general L-amino acid transport system ATP-binding protein